MTNLDVIKYLAYENPKRLGQLLEDIHCYAWMDGSNDKFGDESTLPLMTEWIYEDASTRYNLYKDEELAEWVKSIDYPIIEITYPDNFVVEVPTEGKDPNHMWNTDNSYGIINNAIDEIKLLENITESDKYSSEVYDAFRKEVCAGCSDPNCLRSQAEIYDCDKF